MFEYIFCVQRTKIALPKIKELYVAEVLAPVEEAEFMRKQTEDTSDHNHSVLDHFSGRSV